MKQLYLIGGTMGVGKTTVARILRDRLPAAVMLDGDWCWDARPFVVTDETRAMVLDNICHLLGNFLRTSTYQNVVFSWVMHEQGIIDQILRRLPIAELGCRVVSVSLTCREDVLRSRLEADVRAGLREPDIIGRSIQRLSLYRELRTVLLDTSNMTPEDVAEGIIEIGAGTGAG